MTRTSCSSSDFLGADSLRRSRSHNPFLQSYRSEARVSRSSIIPTALFRRLDITDDMSAHSKDPLLTLSLSSPSFLDSTVQDDMTSFPLYDIKTDTTLSEISRSDEWGNTFQAASIKWPKHVYQNKGKGKATDGVQVQLRSGRWKSVDTFLSPVTVLNSARKFYIPGYSHPLKWKAVGSSFECVAASAKGPIAILDLVDPLSPKLMIFETLHDKHDTRPMNVHRGVSLLLLDYLLVSALLLVTDSQEWTNLRKSEGESSSSPLQARRSLSGSVSPRSISATSTSASQWRKIMYGEPMYPKRLSSTSQPPSTPTSAGQMAKIMFGKPLYPSLRTSSDYSCCPPDFDSDADTSDSDSERPEAEDSEHEDEEEEEEEGVGVQVVTPSRQPSRAPSPSEESVLYPLTTSSAPSHTYLDPLFYNEFNVPPVPKIPTQYAASASSSRVPSPITPGPSSSINRRFRELPRPPSSSHRSQSTPRPRTADPSTSSPVESMASSASDDRRPSYDAAFLVSTPLRMLPLPPPGSPVDGLGPVHPLRHSQSSGRPLHSRYNDKRSSRSANRTLPPTPSQDSHFPKRSFGDLADWLSSTDWPGPHASTSYGRDSLIGIDCPPPAYNSIDFSQPTIPTSVTSLPPAHPPPHGSSSPGTAL
ncbi:hypothetical protein E1B28_000415 [Marasmius oreades]|uniref:Uncharacterized protein n=1 Tax=Marasmius oreades TaxID=181124 RepID=A0A9P8AE36_9AGAR|nr:uncharacterized protein E1B28_000415 [Marasmius oreades]KAG7098471.1 hypothetical protein E1B28_000415 [Marasmius oreades]